MTLPSPRITAVFAAAVAIVVAAAVGSGPSTSAQTGPTVSVDTDPFASPANTASLVGSIEPCRSVPSGSGSLDVDITIQGVASLSGIEADISYNPAVLNVTGMQDNFMLAGGTLLNLSDPLPDSDGTFQMLLATSGEGSGDGVIVRLTLQPVADGASSLDLANVELRDFDANPVLPAAVQDGGIAVGSSCSGDGDGDTMPDTSDNCPTVFNAGQENTDADLGAAGATMAGAPIGDGLGDACDDDDDDDSYSDSDESHIGTMGDDNCAGSPGPGGDGWPADFDLNQVINISDVFNVLPPYFGSSVGGANYSERRDLVPDGVINISDVFKVLPPAFGSSCT